MRGKVHLWVLLSLICSGGLWAFPMMTCVRAYLRNSPSNSSATPSFLLNTHGQLKLSISQDHNLLLVSVLEAREIWGDYQGPCDSYVKVGIVPPNGSKDGLKTQMVPHCANPIFLQTFHFVVSDDVLPRRLLFTMWNSDAKTRISMLLGCMSFSVRSLMDPEKEFEGWYYLLEEDLGCKKHLKVPTSPNNIKAVLSNHGAAYETIDPENMQCLTVTIHRGKDGYGFTICSDSPVRVQAVDPGGPADQAGLQQLDTLLQLNGQPVEQWKCVDLAHAIRNSSNEITVVVWRTGPSAKPNFEGLIHRPTYKSSTSNYDAPSPPTRRRDASVSKTPPAVPPLPAHHRATAARRLLVNGSEAGNSSALGRGTMAWGAQGGSSEELDGKPRLLHHPTATLKGTRVKASNGDNYIILSPITSGGQVPQSGAGPHFHYLLRPPSYHHQSQLVAHPRYVSLPYIPGADR